MNDPQMWTLIGVFTTIMLGGMTLMTTLINRATASAIGGLDAKIDAKIDGLRTEMNARFDTVDTKIEHLDRGVSVLFKRAWGEPSGE